MLEKLKARLCDEAAHWYKLWSSWLALAWGVIVTVFYSYPTLLQEVLSVLPADVKAGLSPIVFALAAGLPILARVLKQRKLEQAKPNG